MHRSELLALLDAYHPPTNNEAAYVARIRDFVMQNSNCFDSDHIDPGHVTGSAWVVNPARDKTLLVHHGKLDQWFQPGGHADGDHDVIRVALREIHEESGLPVEAIRLVDGQIFDVDIHVIPESKHGPRHMHYDIRFLLEIDDHIPVPGSHESHDVKWVPLYEVSRYNNNLSTDRMVQKTRRLRTW